MHSVTKESKKEKTNPKANTSSSTLLNFNFSSTTMSKKAPSANKILSNGVDASSTKKIRNVTKKIVNNCDNNNKSREKISSNDKQQRNLIPLVELNSESSNDGDESDSVKYLLQKNFVSRVPEVLVTSLTSPEVNLLKKRKIDVVNLSDDSSSDDEPIAKKLSPSSNYSSNGENKIKQQNFNKKHSKNVKKFQNNSSVDLNSTKQKLLALKRNATVPTTMKMNKIFSTVISGVKKSPATTPAKKKNVAQTKWDAEDGLPLAKLAANKNILSSSKTNSNSATAKSTASKSPSGQNKSSTPSSKFLSPSKLKERRRTVTLHRLEKLRKAYAEKSSKTNREAYSKCLGQVVTIPLLSLEEINEVANENVKKDLLQRFEREKLKKMSEEQKKEYYRKKHEEQVEKRRHQAERERERFEDTEISNPLLLPDFKPVEPVRGVAPSMYGDVLMVVEFLRTFNELLFTSEKKLMFNVNLANFSQALSVGAAGFEYFGKILVFLVEILLEEKCPVELSTKLDEIEVNVYTASELVRLLLTPSKGAGESSAATADDDEEFDTTSSFGDKLDESLSCELESLDFFHLPPDKVLRIFENLIHDILQTQLFDDFLRKKEDELTSALKDKLSATADLKEYQKTNDEKSNQKNVDKEKSTTNVEASSSSAKSLDIKHFYGVSNAESNENRNVNVADEESPKVADDEDDMIYRVKNRRLLAAREKEKEKQERAKQRKEIELASKINKVETYNKKLTNLQRQTKLYCRSEPLGKDRNHSRYWYFPNVSPYLYVEKGWASGEPITTDTTGSPKKSNNYAITFPVVESNAWYYVESVERFEKLISNLLSKGIRECRLKETLTKCRPEILANFDEFSKNPKDELQTTSDAENLLREFLREEIYNVECKIRQGGLGGSQNFESFQIRLRGAASLEDFGKVVVEAQQNVRPTLLSGMMAVKKSIRTTDDDDGTEGEEKLSDEEKRKQEEVKRTKRIEKWIQSVLACRTWSRMIVLFCMFKNCIMWERSIENSVRCNKCRKNKDDDKVILCEVCNAGYHIYCLRPPLKKIPDGDWYCEQCKPPACRTRSHVRRQSATESGDDEDQHDEVCSRCNEGPEDDDDELIACATCPNSFHKACHEPPLRHTPRVGWRCCQCTKGIIVKRNLRKRRTK